MAQTEPITIPINVSINYVGDEYTPILNIFRPLGGNDDSFKFMAWDLVQRLVRDARTYRTRALVAEEESASARAELSNLQNAVAILTKGFVEEFGLLLDDRK
jgi:hypothetical protein